MLSKNVLWICKTVYTCIYGVGGVALALNGRMYLNYAHIVVHGNH